MGKPPALLVDIVCSRIPVISHSRTGTALQHAVGPLSHRNVLRDVYPARMLPTSPLRWTSDPAAAGDPRLGLSSRLVESLAGLSYAETGRGRVRVWMRICGRLVQGLVVDGRDGRQRPLSPSSGGFWRLSTAAAGDPRLGYLTGFLADYLGHHTTREVASGSVYRCAFAGAWFKVWVWMGGARGNMWGA